MADLIQLDFTEEVLEQYISNSTGEERSTWLLLLALLKQDNQPIEEPVDATDQAIVDAHLRTISNAVTIKDWLEQIKPLERKSVFNCLRRGKMMEALELLQDKPVRAAAMLGGVYYNGVSGNTNRALWLNACYELSRKLKEPIYAYLSANLDLLLETATDFYDRLWCYFHCYVLLSVERHLEKFERKQLIPKKRTMVNQVSFKLEEVLRELEPDNVFNQAQLGLIRGDLNDTLNSRAVKDLEDPETMRFLVHLGVSTNSDVQILLEKYIHHLIERGRAEDAIKYATQLHSNVRVLVKLIHKLALEPVQVKLNTLQLLEENGINHEQLILTGVDFSSLDKTPLEGAAYSLKLRDELNAEEDMRLVGLVEWLLLLNESSVAKINELFRYFLLKNKLNAFVSLYQRTQKLLESSTDEEKDNFWRELICYSLLGKYLQSGLDLDKVIMPGEPFLQDDEVNYPRGEQQRIDEVELLKEIYIPLFVLESDTDLLEVVASDEYHLYQYFMQRVNKRGVSMMPELIDKLYEQELLQQQ